MADEFNPYKVLQVDPEADQEVIQAAYRRLAQKHHPDLSSGPEAAAKMAALNRAWEILGDPARRAEHDRARRAAEDRATESRAAGHTGAPGATGAGHGPSAGPPPGHPSGSVLNFGRYAGWSLGEIARRDLEYLEWLDRAPIGRPYQAEIDALLRRTGRRRTAEVEAADRRGLFRRR
ncbi:MAG: DnaJ domain-containing protein [Chloroflexota bacterium]